MGKIENIHKKTHFATFYLEKYSFLKLWGFAVKITCNFHVQPIKSILFFFSCLFGIWARLMF